MNSSRRQFFKTSIATLGAAVAAPTLFQTLFPSLAQAQAACKFVVPGQGMAAGVNYVEDKKNFKKELQIVRNGVAYKDQDCSTCALYVKDAKEDFGKCALFPNECVKPKAICASWNKKA